MYNSKVTTYVRIISPSIPRMASVYYEWLAEEEKYRLSEQSALLSALLSNPSRGKLSILRRAGLALTGLEVSGMSSGVGGRIVFEFGNPIGSNTESGNGFKAGEMVKIIVNGQLLECTGTVERKRKSSKDITVSLSGNIESEELEALTGENHPRIALIKIVDEAGAFERMKENLNGLLRDDAAVSDLVTELKEFLSGKTPVNIHVDSTSDIISTVDIKTSLNEEQQIAVQKSLEMVESDRVNLMTIHGPPGTGKTSVLVEIISLLLQKKKPMRILVCGPSNLSVDNIIERLETKNSSKLLRIGHPSRVLESCQKNTLDFWSENCDEGKLLKDVQGEIENLEKNQLARCKSWAERRQIYAELKLLRQERRRRERSLQADLIAKAQIVACTLSTAAGKKLRGQKFDLAVVDEAGQALLPEILVAPLLAKKLLLVGDHFQLPPTVMNPEIKPKLEVSLFEKLITGDGGRVMLKEQYRMNELIMKWSNAKFYGNELRAHESVRSRTLEIEEDDSNDCLKDVLIFYDTCGFDLWESVENSSDSSKDGKVKLIEEMSKFNEGEARIVLEHYKQLVTRGVDPSQIAIISPYSAQVTLIREMLQDHVSVEVNSIDAFQGREKDVVILSLVRSNGEGMVGFLGEMRRINVAMTRAKRQLVIVGDSETLSRDEDLKDLMQFLSDNARVEFPQL